MINLNTAMMNMIGEYQQPFNLFIILLTQLQISYNCFTFIFSIIVLDINNQQMGMMMILIMVISFMSLT